MWTSGAARAPNGRPRRWPARRPGLVPAGPAVGWARRPPVTGLAARGQARVLPEPPTDAEKACYPWRSLPSLAAAAWLGTLCVIAAQLLFETRNLGSVPVVAAIFGGYTLVSRPTSCSACR